jgi:hypothetical protein
VRYETVSLSRQPMTSKAPVVCCACSAATTSLAHPVVVSPSPNNHGRLFHGSTAQSR